ncbi:MAG: serine hydrolase domain-containing protein, partial [Chitinophagaceae bacterium]
TLNCDENDSLLFIQDTVQPYRNVHSDYILNLLKKTAAIPDHGTYAYSNFNYAISGLILEKVTDKKNDDLLSEEIFKPLHFTETFTDSIFSENRAAGYLEENKASYMELDALKPAGIIKSSAVDLIKFLQAELLPSNNDLGKAMQLTQETLLQTPDFATGFGWHIFTDDENNKAWLMQGDTIGNSSMLYFDRKNNVGIVLLANESNHNLVATIMDFLVNSISQN